MKQTRNSPSCTGGLLGLGILRGSYHAQTDPNMSQAHLLNQYERGLST